MQERHLLYAVHVTDRVEHAVGIQDLLTKYSASIKTRLGLHEVSATESSPNGLMVLEMFGDEKKCQEMFDKLNAIVGVEVKSIFFDHP